jgi:hypothetical protein
MYSLLEAGQAQDLYSLILAIQMHQCMTGSLQLGQDSPGRLTQLSPDMQ